MTKAQFSAVAGQYLLFIKPLSEILDARLAQSIKYSITYDLHSWLLNKGQWQLLMETPAYFGPDIPTCVASHSTCPFLSSQMINS